jgi:hypothetical protein
VKLGILVEIGMGRMMAGSKYVPQPLGKLMHIKEEWTLPTQIVRRTSCKIQNTHMMEALI